MQERELVIIGGGPAGLTAAIYGKRAGLDVLVLEKNTHGGQILITHEVENWPGTQHIAGYELADNFYNHAIALEAEFKSAVVQKIIPGSNYHTLETSEGPIKAKAVIIATGASFRRLGCKGEADLTGSGVSYCAVCDGPFFRNEKVAVIGGGNTAVEEAEYLTRFADAVYIVHRRDTFRADRLIAQRALNNPKIIPVWDSVVESINGEKQVQGLTVKHVKTNDTVDLDVTGVFIFVGTLPNVTFLDKQLERVDGGWIATNEQMQTSVPGIFAAGDVRSTPLRQVVTAASDGAIAAMAAYSHIISL